MRRAAEGPTRTGRKRPVRHAGYQPPPAQYYYTVPLEDGQRDQCEAAVRRVLGNELRSLPTKLAVANERLFDRYDRLSAEAVDAVREPTTGLTGRARG